MKIFIIKRSTSLDIGFCGFFGVLACGVFGTDNNAAFAGYVGSSAGYHPIRSGEQFGVQVVGAFTILAWTLGTSFPMFAAIKYTIGLRVSDDVEEAGLDASEHGAKAYVIEHKDVLATKTVEAAPTASGKQYTDAHVVPAGAGQTPAAAAVPQP